MCVGGGGGMGRPLHRQVEHHVQTKFATPILHATYNVKI